VMNQSVGPGNPGDIFYLTRVMLFITLLCTGYVLSRPNPDTRKEEKLLLPDTTPEWAGTLPWQKKASEKAVSRYADSQERKWQRWNEVMFERSS
jgi:hypothetical protein